MHERSATWRWTYVVAALGIIVALAPQAVARVPGGPGSSETALRSDASTARIQTDTELHERNLVWWPYATGPYYGDTAAAAMRAEDVIITDVGSFRISERPDLPAPLTGSLAGLANGVKQHFVVQLRAAALAEEPYAETLRSLGAEIVDFLPVNAMVLRLDKAAYDLVSASPMVQFIEPYHPAYKISPRIGQVPQLTAEAAASPLVTLHVRLFLGEPAAPVAELAQRVGATVRLAQDVAGAPGFLDLEVPAAQIPELARIEAIQHLAETGPVLTQGNYGVTAIQSPSFTDGDYPYWKEGLQGDGQVIQITDTGTNVAAGHLSHTRTQSGWTGANGPAGPNVLAGHRKVVAYTAASAFTNDGTANSDVTNCDGGGYPHGSLVVGAALGSATRGRVPVGEVPSPTDDRTTNPNVTYGAIDYGAGYFADGNLDRRFSDGNSSEDTGYDGIAKGARLVFVDAQAGCPESDLVQPGNLTNIISNTWAGTGNYKATIHNFSLGPLPSATSGPDYTTGAAQIDAAVRTNPINLVVVASGNFGPVPNGLGSSDKVGTVTDWATCKNCISAGGSQYTGGEIYFNNSEGPGPSGTKRHVVHVLGNAWDNTCRSGSSSSSAAVNCANYFTLEGTSLAAGSLSGAAAIVREYFADGFYPDGTNVNEANNAEKAPAVSSTLIRALMIAGSSPIFAGKQFTGQYRFGHIWGYGQFFLNRALPLAAYTDKTVSGLIVHDRPGNIDGQPGDDGVPSVLNPPLPDTAPAAGTRASSEFELFDTREDLAAALTWLDESTGAAVADDLDLELTWCGADRDCNTTADNVTWTSNIFTDDADQDNSVNETGEKDMLNDNRTTGWFYSLADSDITGRGAVVANYRSKTDNMEAVFLPTYRQAISTEDDNRDGTPDNKYLEYVKGSETGCPDAPALGPNNNYCARVGKWRVTVYRATGSTPNLRYAVAIAGSVVAQSRIAVDKNPLTCNDQMKVTIFETPDATDPSCKAANNCPLETVASRLTLQVFNAAGAVIDTESDVSVRQSVPSQMKYEVFPPPALASSGSPVSNDGTLTLANCSAGAGLEGCTIQVGYADVKNTTTTVRAARATVDCRPKIDLFRVGQLGPDLPFTLGGGCDGDPYLDAQESFTVLYQYTNRDEVTLYDTRVSFAVVENTPPYTTPAPDVTVIDPVKEIGTLFFGTTQATSFAFKVNGVPPGRKLVKLKLCLSSTQSGQQVEDCVLSDAVMQADEEKFLYITDCPQGCTLDFDRNFDEKYENSIAINPDDLNDGIRRNLDETAIVYSSLINGNCTGCGNPGFNGPWNFDTDREGFRVGKTAQSATRIATTQITNWGEDTNWDDILQVDEEDRDTEGVVGQLDYNWGTAGGCGWMSKASGATTGGVWHTGKVGAWAPAHATQICAPGVTPDPRPNDNICERYNAHDGSDGSGYWWEALRSPTIHPVNFPADAGNVLDWQTRILAWEWNMQWDAADPYVAWITEFDVDTAGVGDAVSLGDDLLPTGNSGGGNFGLLQGGQLNVYGGAFAFADTDPVSGDELVTTKGGNRSGRRGCYFNDLATEDLNLDGAGLTAADRLVRQPRPADDECDNEFDLGLNGCPGSCGVDDDNNGLVDDTREICPCKVCNAGQRANQACSTAAECNPTPPPAGQRGNLCVTATDASGIPIHKYGDDVCGTSPASTDEGVSDIWGDDGAGGYPMPTQRQTRNRTYAVTGQNIYQNTIEDVYGPAGKDWATEIGFLVQASSGTPLPKRGYGMALDDMVIEWQESRPKNQTSTDTCTTANNPVYPNQGECAQIFVGTIFNTTTGDAVIPVSVLDTFPVDNLVNCGPNGEQGVQVLVNSFAERGEQFCLLPVAPGANEYAGEVKTSTRVKKFGDGYTFIAFNGLQQPSITVNYIDKNDKVHPYNQGADGRPGIANFDDDGNGTIDNVEEFCPTQTQLGSGRSPHQIGQKARYSDDNCGCLDNPIAVSVSSFFDVVDIVLTDVRVWDDTDATRGTDGDNDGFADPDETIALSITIRNQSEFPVKDLKLKLSSDSPLVKWFVVDELSLGTIEKNPLDTSGTNQIDTAALPTPAYFKFVAAPATRTNLYEDLSSLFTLSVSGTAVAGPDSFSASGAPILVDVPIFGTAVAQGFKVVHNLESAGTRAADYYQDFEAALYDKDIICPPYGTATSCDAPAAAVQFIKRVTGDDVSELRGTYCQDSDPFNPQSPRSIPANYCELGNGYSNVITENYWHLHGDRSTDGTNQGNCGRPTGCPDRGRSMGTGRRSLGSSKVQITGTFDNGLTSTVNRMYWVETKDAFQLGVGKSLNDRTPKPCTAAPCTSAADQAPVLEYWTQLSILDHRLVSPSGPTEAFEAALVYACVDKDGDNACDTKEDGAGPDDEKWEPIRAYVSPESEFREPGGCLFDPSDDGSTSSEFYEGSVAFGPSSTCYPLAVDGCLGRTMDPNPNNPYLRMSPSCWPETGGESEGDPNGYGPGTWIRKAYNLKAFRGQRVLFRWHVSPATFPAIGTCASYFTDGGCANTDDGWYLDNIRIYGLASGSQPTVDNTPETPAPVQPATVVGLVARLGAIAGNERGNEDFLPNPAAACSDTSAPTYCDFDNDGTLDKDPATGQPVTNTTASQAAGQPYLLSGLESSATSCLGGGLEFRFETSTGATIRDWLTNTEDVRVAPTATTTYVLKARCTTAPATVSNASITITLPGGGCLDTGSLVVAADKQTIDWEGIGTSYDVAKGDVAALLAANGSFSGGGATCLENNSDQSRSSDTQRPQNGKSFYYVARCDGETWNDGTQTGNRDASLTICP